MKNTKLTIDTNDLKSKSNIDEKQKEFFKKFFENLNKIIDSQDAEHKEFQEENKQLIESLAKEQKSLSDSQDLSREDTGFPQHNIPIKMIGEGGTDVE